MNIEEAIDQLCKGTVTERVWKAKIDIKDLWDKVSEYEITLTDFTKQVAAKLRALKGRPWLDSNEIEELANELISAGETEDKDEFDYIWNDVYDWADRNSVWIGF